MASGASRIGFWRYEKERRRSSQVRRLREHPSAAARSPFPMGKAAIREYSFSRIVKANTGYVEKKNNDGQSLPLVGKVASKASRIGQWRYEREWEMRLKPAIYENTRVPPQKEANPASLRSAAPSKGRGSRGHSLLPMEGGAPKGRRLDGESEMKKSEGDCLKYAIYESALSTSARSPFPKGEGYDTRVPLSPTQSLPLKGKGASGASRIGY